VPDQKPTLRPLAPTLALLLLVPPPAARAQERPKRTLAELVAIARRRSATVAAAESNVAVREAQRSEAIRNWWPTGEFNTLLTIAPSVKCLPSYDSTLAFQSLTRSSGMPSGIDILGDNPVAVAYREQNCANTVDPRTVSNNPSTGLPFDANGLILGKNITTLSPNVAGVGIGVNLRLTQPIYTFGKIEHGVRAADRGIDAERARVEAARDEAELNVARAYWGVKAARAAQATAGDARQELADRLQKVQEDLESDSPKFTVNDMQRLKVALAQADLVVAEAERTLSIAESGLSAAIGEPTDVDDAELDPVEIVEHPLEYYQDAALIHRPEVRAFEAGVAAMRELQKEKFSEMLPDFAFVFGLDYRYAPTVEDSTNAFVNHANQVGYSAFLTLHQPLDFVERHAHYLKARADADQMAAQRKLAETGIGWEIAQAWANLTEARKRLKVADRGQHVAQGWLNAVRENIDLGTADSRDLVEAARSYYELRLRYYQAIFDANVDVAVLRKASGVEIAK